MESVYFGGWATHFGYVVKWPFITRRKPKLGDLLTNHGHLCHVSTSWDDPPSSGQVGGFSEKSYPGVAWAVNFILFLNIKKNTRPLPRHKRGSFFPIKKTRVIHSDLGTSNRRGY